MRVGGVREGSGPGLIGGGSLRVGEVRTKVRVGWYEMGLG